MTSVIAGHGMWKYRLHNTIETGHSDASPEKVARDDQCPLGKWVHGDARTALGPGELERIRELHAAFHRHAADVLKLALAGEKSAAREQLGSGSQFLRLPQRWSSSWTRSRPSGRGGHGPEPGADPLREELVGVTIETAAQVAVASQAAEDVSANVTAVAAAAEEMSSAISEVARNTSRAAGTAASAVTSAEEAAAMVNRLARGLPRR